MALLGATLGATLEEMEGALEAFPGERRFRAAPPRRAQALRKAGGAE